MRTLLLGTIGTLALASAPLSWAAAPTANNDFRTISVGASITINALNNDSDPDGDLIRIASIGRPNVGNATLRQQDSAIVYTAPADFKGQVTFTYTLEDIPNASTETAPQQTTGTIVINVVAFGGSSAGSNQQSVGQALVKACDSLDSANSNNLAQGQLELKQRCAGLVYLQINNPGGLNEVVRQISPEETLALAKAATGATEAISAALGKRLGSINSSTSFSLNGQQWQQDIGGAAGDDLRSSPWGLFATAQLETADKDRTQLENGFNYSANSLLVGVDYRLSADWVIGVAGGFGKNDLDFLNKDGSVTTDTQSAIFYHLLNFDAFSWDVQLGISNSSYDINRRIHYNDTQANEWTSTASTSGQQIFANTTVQYQFSYRALSLFPSLKVGVSQSTLDAYGENNLGGYEVSIGEQKEQQTKIEAGLQGQYALNFGWGVLTPTASANFISRASSSKDPVNGTFAYGPLSEANFVMTPEEFDSSYYQVSLGTSAVFPNGFSAFITAQQTLGYENYSSQQYSLGVRVEL
ncbi:MAG: autotransporter domain-containing protein [Marinagarivorans sp.]